MPRTRPSDTTRDTGHDTGHDDVAHDDHVGYGRPGTNLAIRVESEADIQTLPGAELDLRDRLGSDFGSVLDDAATRPGEYVRAESDFSDLAEPDPAAKRAEPARPASRAANTGASAAGNGSLADDPPTAPHDVMPEVHSRGGLQPFASARRFGDEPTNTSPSIEIIREPSDDSIDMPADVPAGARSAPITSPPFERDAPTGEMAAELVRDLKRASITDDPLVELAIEAHAHGAIVVHEGAPVAVQPTGAVPPATPNPSATLFGVGRVGEARATSQRMPSPTPPSLVPSSHPPAGLAPLPTTPPNGGPPPHPGMQAPRAVQSLSSPPPPLRGQPAFSLPSGTVTRRRRWPLAIGALVVLGTGAAVAAWQIGRANDTGNDTGSDTGSAGGVTTGSSTTRASRGSNGSSAAAGSSDATGTNAHEGSSHATGSDAVATARGSAASGSGARPETSQPNVPPVAPSDALQIASKPGGARVFIDGADQGVTPVKLAGSADRHTMALLLAGHELYVAEVDGHGSFQVPLKSITPSGGPAGIKVIRCKDKDRYYVFVDGKPTGMTCPTERIECTTGPHTVEVYDLVTENRRKWDITVTDTRLSYRVRVD